MSRRDPVGQVTARTVFVPESTMGSRQETAVLLVGTAREFGIDQHAIVSTQGGYWITEELAAIVYDEGDQIEEPEPEPEPPAKKKATKKTSGNRAAKVDTDEESA